MEDKKGKTRGARYFAFLFSCVNPSFLLSLSLSLCFAMAERRCVEVFSRTEALSQTLVFPVVPRTPSPFFSVHLMTHSPYVSVPHPHTHTPPHSLWRNRRTHSSRRGRRGRRGKATAVETTTTTTTHALFLRCARASHQATLSI